jgi:RNA polymerase sigma factor (sigma-70 family)
MNQWTDKQLFDALRADDRDALSILFLRHYDHLIHYGLQTGADRTLVEGSIQELFMYIFQSFNRFVEVKMVRAYLFKSLRRRVLEKIREEKKMKTSRDKWLYHLDIQFSSSDIEIQKNHKGETNKLLLNALNILPWRQREAIYLRYYNCLSTREIAEIMGVANQTVLNTLHQALKKLRTSNISKI